MKSRWLSCSLSPLPFSLDLLFLLSAVCLLTAERALSQEANLGDQVNQAEINRLQQLYGSIVWEKGPTTAKLGTLAEIQVPQGYQFTGAAGAAAWEELNQNPRDPSELGILKPEDGEWFLVFSYSDVGYIRDDEKAKLDANAILESIRAGTEASNAERRNRGWQELKILGWIQPPAYDPNTHRLGWAIRAMSGGEIANYNTRLLGRGGVMAVTLVGDPQQMGTLVPTVNNLLSAFNFTQGNKYAEWQTGDKVAAYGLTGLITGGAAVVAAKTGLLAKLLAVFAKAGKAIVIGIAALCAGIWKMITGITGRGNKASS